MSDAPSPLASYFPVLSGVVAAISTGIVFAFSTGRKLAVLEHHGAAIATLTMDHATIDRKLDHVVDGIGLVGKANARIEAEIEALRRDINRLEAAP